MTTEVTEKQNEIAPFDPAALSEYIQSAPAIYQDLSIRTAKAVEAGNDLLEKAQTEGIDQELAEKIVTFIKKANATKDFSNKKRTPITQLFHEVIKGFTSLENNVKDITGKLKKVLDDYATQEAEKERKRQEKLRQKAEAEAEKGELAAMAENGLRQAFITLLNQKKTYLHSILEDMELPIADNVRATLKTFDEALPVKELKWPPLYPVYTSDEELKAIKKEVGARLASEMKVQYSREIADLKKELSDKVPSKISELQAIEKANKKEKERLKAEAEKRRKDQEKKLAEEAEAKKQEAEKEAKAKSDATAMNAMFTVEQAASESTVPKGKTEYTITVTHQQGYAEMFAMWFAKEGYSLPMDKLEKMTLGRVKKYFEKLASDEDEKLQSKFFKYVEGYKTNVRR